MRRKKMCLIFKFKFCVQNWRSAFALIPFSLTYGGRLWKSVDAKDRKTNRELQIVDVDHIYWGCWKHFVLTVDATGSFVDLR